MIRISSNTYFLDVEQTNGNSVSFAKSSIKNIALANMAVRLELLDDKPYFLDYRFIENPLTPGIPYISAALLYDDILSYMYIEFDII